METIHSCSSAQRCKISWLRFDSKENGLNYENNVQNWTLGAVCEGEWLRSGSGPKKIPEWCRLCAGHYPTRLPRGLPLSHCTSSRDAVSKVENLVGQGIRVNISLIPSYKIQ